MKLLRKNQPVLRKKEAVEILIKEKIIMRKNQVIRSLPRRYTNYSVLTVHGSLPSG
jgi:hypothetical protein